jgi:hypothetical protein
MLLYIYGNDNFIKERLFQSIAFVLKLISTLSATLHTSCHFIFPLKNYTNSHRVLVPYSVVLLDC